MSTFILKHKTITSSTNSNINLNPNLNSNQNSNPNAKPIYELNGPLKTKLK